MQTGDVQSLIELLEPEVEASVDPEPTVNKSPTVSEKSNQDEGEVEQQQQEQKPEASAFEDCVKDEMAEQAKKVHE